MYIGNIVSQVEVKTNKLFNSVTDINNIIYELPTLIIGWEFVKLIYRDNKPSILDKEITNNLWWTFTKKERRSDFEEDNKWFIEKCIENASNKIPYEFLNILTGSKNNIKELIKKITSTKVYSIYIKNNSFIYIFIDDKIIGIDFNAIDFLKIERKKVYRILYSNNNNVFFNEDFLDKEIKINIKPKNNKLIPYLSNITNGE